MLRTVMGCICGKETLQIEGQEYVVKSRLGEGFVDLVENARTRRVYALKRIACHSREDQDKFLKEVEYMKMFKDHHNIIRLDGHQVVPVNNVASSIVSRILILMPYYSGGTLQDQLDSGVYMKQADLIHIFHEVCSAVQVLHSHSPPVAHRDIKPANVLITADGQAVLMDLGSCDQARAVIRTARDGQRLQDDAAERCTMPFRAPELFNVQTGDDISEATDIWSLGCLLYACIYLKGPFDETYSKGGSIALAAVGGNVEYPDQLKYNYKFVTLAKVMLNVAADQRPNIGLVIERVESIKDQIENRV